MGVGMQIASTIVKIVHDLTRDALTQLAGTAISAATTAAATLGFGTPWAVAQVSTRVAALSARVGKYKAVFNLRGDDGAHTGGLAVDSNLGWKGAEKYVAIVPQVFDLWQDPQERYDVFMNNYTEHTWTMVTFNESITKLMKTYVKYPPRKMQGEGYSGPITLSGYERFKNIRDSLEKDGVKIPLPAGN